MLADDSGLLKTIHLSMPFCSELITQKLLGVKNRLWHTLKKKKIPSQLQGKVEMITNLCEKWTCLLVVVLKECFNCHFIWWRCTLAQPGRRMEKGGRGITLTQITNQRRIRKKEMSPWQRKPPLCVSCETSAGLSADERPTLCMGTLSVLPCTMLPLTEC